eukprot:s5088_g2.t2
MPSRNDSHKAAFGVDGLREVSSLSRCPGVRCVVASCRAGRSFQRLRELKTAACLFDAARCTQLRGTQPVRTYVLKLFGRVVRLGWTILARGRALGLPACFQDVTSPAVKLKQPIAYELQDHLEHAAALVSDFSRSRLESRRTSVLKDSPTGTELTLPSEAVAARAKAQKAVDPPEGASAPTPKPLEVRVVEKFKRHNARYMDGWKESLPHLSKPATSAPPAGRGGVSWIGQNPDPCRAKYLLKQGVVPLPPAVEQKPSPSQAVGVLSELSHSQSAPVLQKRGHRQLEMMSCNEHYIEQRLKLEDEQQLRSGPDMKELIYHGVSHDHQGRRAYLQARRRLWPQDRLPAPVTSAAEVGWQSYAGPDKIVGKQFSDSLQSHDIARMRVGRCMYLYEHMTFDNGCQGPGLPSVGPVDAQGRLGRAISWKPAVVQQSVSPSAFATASSRYVSWVPATAGIGGQARQLDPCPNAMRSQTG